MDIKRLLKLTGVGYVLTLIIIMIIFLMQSGSSKTQIDKLVKKDQVLLVNLSEMYAQGLQTGQALRNILLNEQDKTAMKNLEKASEDFQKAYEQAVTVAGKTTAEKLSKVNALWNEDKSMKSRVRELAGSGKKDEALTFLNDQETAKWRETKALILDMLESQKVLVSKEVEENRRQMRSNTIVMAIVMTIALVSSLALLLILYKRIVRPLSDFVEKIERVAGGDLGVDFDYQRQDEVGAVSKSMDRMISYLRETILNLMSSVNSLTSSVANLEIKSESATMGARNQSDQSRQIAAAAEQMSQTITDMSQNATAMANTSQNTMQTAQDGKRLADCAVESVTHVNDSTGELSHMISLLDHKVGQIDHVVTMISEIADQTNLLALNAAIEAARAGDQGRGFAVVADEVRKLAERTIEATKEIVTTIGSVQVDSRKTIESMGKASLNVVSATDQIKRLSGILSEMVQSLERVQDQTAQIATAIEEQSATSDEIARNVAGTSNIAQKIEVLSGEVMDEARSISCIAKNLEASGKHFKIGI
jgi:methyl-accepting chemotaxis protein